MEKLNAEVVTKLNCEASSPVSQTENEHENTVFRTKKAFNSKRSDFKAYRGLASEHSQQRTQASVACSIVASFCMFGPCSETVGVWRSTSSKLQVRKSLCMLPYEAVFVECPSGITSV